MSNLKIVIPAIVVFILALGGAYFVYQRQTEETNPEVVISPPLVGFQTESSPSPTSTPSQGSQAQAQPQTGEGAVPHNVGLSVSSPQSNDSVTSPLRVTGRANVPSGEVLVQVEDSNGAVLGSSKATACFGLDDCPFETLVVFARPNSTSGIVRVYSLTTDGQTEFLQTVSVRF